MSKLIKFLKLLDENLVKIFLVGFIFLIPLWPKLPLKMINYTYIAIRFEDLYLALMAFVFFIQLLRKKVTLNKKFAIMFGIFWLAVFASLLWGIYGSHTVIYHQVGFLNALRRVEYMIVFFIASSVIKSKKDFFQLLNLYFFTVLLVVIYGFGQKFFNFPAVQTMNAEYAKGYLLYLTPDARISSTFAGHYDLAAYLVFAIPMIVGAYFFSNKKRYMALFIGALIILIYTASRISFGAYIVAAVGLLLLIKKYWHLFFVLLLTGLLMFVTGDLTQRFLKTFQVRRILVDDKTGAVYIGQKISTKELPAGSFYIKLKDQSASKTASTNVNVFKNEVLDEKLKEATVAGNILTATEKQKLIATFSANVQPINTVVSDISFATRLQIEWPRAINAFKSNLILGTGPSSITEATDNDFLRWLGEFGLFGTVSFLAIIFFIVKGLWDQSLKLAKNDRFIILGFIFGLIGVLINATYIDVFEASKVAFVLWTVSGLFVGYYLSKI